MPSFYIWIYIYYQYTYWHNKEKLFRILSNFTDQFIQNRFAKNEKAYKGKVVKPRDIVDANSMM